MFLVFLKGCSDDDDDDKGVLTPVLVDIGANDVPGAGAKSNSAATIIPFRIGSSCSSQDVIVCVCRSVFEPVPSYES